MIWSKLRAFWLPSMWKDVDELHKLIDTQVDIMNERADQIQELEDEISTLKASMNINNKEIGYSPVSTAELMRRADWATHD